jgi:hypothetical protein
VLFVLFPGYDQHLVSGVSRTLTESAAVRLDEELWIFHDSKIREDFITNLGGSSIDEFLFFA